LRTFDFSSVFYQHAQQLRKFPFSWPDDLDFFPPFGTAETPSWRPFLALVHEPFSFEMVAPHQGSHAKPPSSIRQPVHIKRPAVYALPSLEAFFAFILTTLSPTPRRCLAASTPLMAHTSKVFPPPAFRFLYRSRRTFFFFPVVIQGQSSSPFSLPFGHPPSISSPPFSHASLIGISSLRRRRPTLPMRSTVPASDQTSSQTASPNAKFQFVRGRPSPSTY